MTVCILDTETTSRADDREPIEIALLGLPRGSDLLGENDDVIDLSWPPELRFSARLKPSKPLTFGSIAVHHILPSELEYCEPWPGTWSPPAGVEYIVAHSADFDWKAIGSPHVARICTLALARSLWPNIDSHKLGALTYFLEGRTEATRTLLQGAHSAATDLILLGRLLCAILQLLPGTTTWHQLWLASERALIPTHLSFGKYGPFSDWAKANGQKKGMPIVELRRLDPGYLRWLLSGACDVVNEDLYLQKALRGEAA